MKKKMLREITLTRARRDQVADHALARLRERCGVRANRAEYELLCLHIARGHAGDPAAYSDDGCPIYRLRIKGIEAFAVFMPENEAVCTFLAALFYRQAMQATRRGVSLGGHA